MDERVPFVEQRMAFYHGEWVWRQYRESLYVEHSPSPTEDQEGVITMATA